MLIVPLENKCTDEKSGRVMVKVYSDPEYKNVVETTYGYFSRIAPGETVNVRVMIDVEKIPESDAPFKPYQTNPYWYKNWIE
jgi:hypothetical protein